jgi:hypothetical protein
VNDFLPPGGGGGTPVAADQTAAPTPAPTRTAFSGQAGLSDADLWEGYVKAGVDKGTATNLVKQRSQIQPMDAWEIATKAGGNKDQVTAVLNGAPNAPSAGMSFLQHAANQELMGFGPKLSGAASGIESLAKGGDYMPAYEAERNRVQQRLDEEGQAHPAASWLGGGAGAVANPANLALGAGGAAVGEKLGGSMLARIFGDALSSSAAGATHAAAKTVGGVGDYAKNVGEGAGEGFVAGAGLSALGQGVGTGTSALAAKGDLPALQATIAQSPNITDPKIAGEFIKAALNRPAIATALKEGQDALANAGGNLGSGQTGVPPAVLDYTRRALVKLVAGGKADPTILNYYDKSIYEPASQIVPELGAAKAAGTNLDRLAGLTNAVTSPKGLTGRLAGLAGGQILGGPPGALAGSLGVAALQGAKTVPAVTSGFFPTAASFLTGPAGDAAQDLLAAQQRRQ